MIIKEKPDVIGNLELKTASEKVAIFGHYKPVLATFHWSDAYRSGFEKWQDESCPSSLFEAFTTVSLENDPGVRVPRVYKVCTVDNTDVLAVFLWEENQTSSWYFVKAEG